MDVDDKERASQRGSRIGWLGGWAGGFSWLLIIAVIRLSQGNTAEALWGILLTMVAFAMVWCLRPWKYPDVRIWKLMVPLYLVFLLSIPWAVWTLGGFDHPDLRWWMFLWILPCMTPFWTIGLRRWNDIHNAGVSSVNNDSQEEVSR